jgi:hypothetical protein
LELYLKGMYVMCPYLEYQYARVLPHIRYIRYLITMRYYMEFLRTILLVAKLRVQHMRSHPHGKPLPLILRTTF